eukprot:g8113.t1
MTRGRLLFGGSLLLFVQSPGCSTGNINTNTIIDSISLDNICFKCHRNSNGQNRDNGVASIEFLTLIFFSALKSFFTQAGPHECPR